MPQISWKLGRVAGIDLFLHPSFLILPLMILLTGGGGLGLLLVGLVFGCVLLHELGHALMARQYGIETADITLYPIGGVARLDRMPRGGGPELLIALAGPAVNLGIAAMLWATLTVFGPWLHYTLLGSLMAEMLWINVGLLVFNMLPVFPMDGGRVLRALLSGWVGRARATEVAATIGRGIAIVAGIWFLLNGWYMQAALAAFIYTAGSMELGAVRRDEARRNRGDWPAPPPGYRWIDRGDGVFQLAPIVVTVGPSRGGSWR
jgi:Zn-dependent protease